MYLKHLLLAAALAASSAFATVNHQPFGPVDIGQRATVKGAWQGNSISDARLYFKSNVSKKFSFVELDYEKGELVAQLPAPGATMKSIEYFFAVKQNDGDLVQSDVFKLNVSGNWTAESVALRNETIQTFSELGEEEDSGIVGFIDNIKTVYQYAKLVDKLGTAIELASLSNYSVVAGPSMASTSTASTSASSAASTSSSTAAASSGGWGVLGTTAAVVGGVGIAAAAAAAAEEEEEFSISSCNNFGWEIADSSSTFRAAWWFSNGRIVYGFNDGSGCVGSQTVSGGFSSCSEIEDALRETCSLYPSDIQCRLISSKPSYLSC